MKKITVFPGWGYPADFYNFLKELYEEVDIVSGYKPIEKEIKSDVILAWSMGSINCMLNIEKILADKIIFISPTFNFMSSVRASSVRAMINKIKKNKKELLKEFYKINFYDSKIYDEFLNLYLEKGCSIEDEELIDGLKFLMNTVIEKQIQINAEIVVLSGEKDAVIPYENSRDVAEKVNGKFILFKESGHNIISERKDELIEILRR